MSLGWDVPRSVWGPSGRPGPIKLKPVVNVFGHHTVTSAATPIVRELRELERHALALGHTGGIDYSAVVNILGTKGEGRGWGRSGGHTINNNSTSYGIAIQGDMRYDPITDRLVQGVSEVIADGVKRGWIDPNFRFRPHYTVFATACNRNFDRWHDEVTRRVKRLVAGGSDLPVLDEIGDEMKVIHETTRDDRYLVDLFFDVNLTKTDPDAVVPFVKFADVSALTLAETMVVLDRIRRRRAEVMKAIGAAVKAA